jgi:hypothetical protein
MDGYQDHLHYTAQSDSCTERNEAMDDIQSTYVSENMSKGQQKGNLLAVL